MREQCVSKRTGLLLGFVAVMIVTAVAVAFYFIGLHSNQCVPVPDGLLLYNNNSSPANKAHDGRLPRHIEPILYNIEIFPDIYGTDPTQFYFFGSMWLHFRCLEHSGNITLNINELNIQRLKINSINGSQETTAKEITKYTINETWQFLVIYVKVPFEAGRDYSIEISYFGHLTEDYAGLYLSKFPQNSTGHRYVAATQFSPTDARKAFPCLDEPDRKAHFDITLIRRTDLVTLSNMPRVKIEHREKGFVADVYQRTPKMSTYLVAMVFGNFASLTISARPGLNYTCWAWEGNINKTRTGLQFGAEVLAFFESYFENVFPLPKQDMAAVPETAVGAMENWGLIIYREERIFFQPGVDGIMTQIESSRTISHELAHQWFGNLVTQQWWSDLFLKEGFAVYFAEVGINQVHPDWNIMDLFGVGIMHTVFETDGLESSHPVYMELADTTQIRQVFDAISYSKGGCMIRMLNFILGDEAFQAGLKNYLLRLKYGNVGHNGLWTAVETDPPSFPSVHDVMNSWILQKNYPVVTIEQIRPGIIYVKQERFLNNPDIENNSTTDRPIWKIPFTFTTSTERNFTVHQTRILWVEHADMILIDREIPDMTHRDSWIVANIQQMGYYRVNYGLAIWRNIIEQLVQDNKAIHAVNRAQIINDLFSLSKAERVPMKTALGVLGYLQYEQDYVPWRAALNERAFMDKLVKHTNIFTRFQDAWKYLVNNPLAILEEEMTRTNLSVPKRLLYAELFSVGTQYGIYRCLNKSKTDFNNLKVNDTKIDADTRDASLCSVMKNASVTDWEFILLVYNITVDVNEKRTYLYSLTCTSNEDLQHRLIRLTEDSFTMKGSDAVLTLTLLANNPLSLSKVWNYVSLKWDYFLDKFDGSLFQLARLVSGITDEFTTASQLNELETFVKVTSDLGPARQSFLQAIEKTKANVKWLERNQDSVEQWINILLESYT